MRRWFNSRLESGWRERSFDIWLEREWRKRNFNIQLGRCLESGTRSITDRCLTSVERMERWLDSQMRTVAVWWLESGGRVMRWLENGGRRLGSRRKEKSFMNWWKKFRELTSSLLGNANMPSHPRNFALKPPFHVDGHILQHSFFIGLCLVPW